MADQKPYNEKEVLELLARGSSYAFAQIFDRYRPKVFSVALRICKSSIQAQEIVQEVFLKVWKKREDFRYVRDLESYLHATARNILYNDLENQAKATVAQSEFAYDLSHLQNTIEAPDEIPYKKILLEIIESMPPQQKEVFRLVKIQGLKYEAAAKQLGLTHFTVKTHVANALQFIRMRLQGQAGSLLFIGTLIKIFNEN